MHTHTHTHPANRHPFIPVQHGPLTPGSPKKLCPRCPTGNTPALAKVPPTSAGTWVQDWDPHTEASASPPWHTVRGQSRIYFPPAQIHPTPLCPYLCAHTSRGQEGNSRDQGHISGVWGRSCSSLGQRWAWAVNPGSGNKRLCTGTAQELLLLLQVVAFEQKWHLQTLDMQLSNQGPRITPDRGNCQLSPLGEKC